MFLEAKAIIINRRAENNEADIHMLCKNYTWLAVIRELPEDLRAHITKNHSANDIDEVGMEINEWTGNRPQTSPFSPDNLKREQEHRMTWRETYEKGLTWPLPPRKPKLVNYTSQNHRQNRHSTNNVLALTGVEDRGAVGGENTQHRQPERDNVSIEHAYAMANSCYLCKKEGHLMKDCQDAPAIKQTVASGKSKEENNRDRRYRNSNRNKTPNKRIPPKTKYWCGLCKKSNHSLQKCVIMIRAKALLKYNEPERSARTNIAAVAVEDPMSQELTPVREMFQEVVRDCFSDTENYEAKVNFIMQNDMLYDSDRDPYSDEEEEAAYGSLEEDEEEQ